MIDYLTVDYKNYDLLNLQLDNFKKRFSEVDYRLVVVDNTPDNEKRPIERKEEIDLIVELESYPTFDGISHGNAINTGLQYCESKTICLFDTDFFFLKDGKQIHNYIDEKFSLGYRAVGTELNDGDGTNPVVNRFIDNFRDIPCCFGSFYDLELAQSCSWIISPDELNVNVNTGFIEVGWRIRKKILEDKIKTMYWKTDSTKYGDCFFRNENEEVMGFHYVGGCHRRWNNNSYEEIENIVNTEY